MFDANARGTPQGQIFFAEVDYCNNKALHAFGITAGELLLCRMLSKNSDNPKVIITVGNKSLIIQNDDYEPDAYLVYAGLDNLRGFINDTHKAKAKQMLEALDIKTEQTLRSAIH